MSPQKIATILILVSMMLKAGTEINLDHLVAALKNYGLLLRALLANFIIVPLFGVLTARVFNLNESVATGFLLMAIAPGVPFLVEAAGRKSGGSLGFAAELAFIMPALSIVTIPLTVRLIFPPDAVSHIPAGQLIVTLVGFQLVPLLIGLLIADRAPAFAAKLQRPLGVVFLASILALFVILGPQLVHAISAVYGSRVMLATLVLVLLSILTGWILGGPQVKYRRTLSIATALRNIGTCAVIAIASFPDTLVGPTVLTYFLIQFVVDIFFRRFFHRTATSAAAA